MVSNTTNLWKWKLPYRHSLGKVCSVPRISGTSHDIVAAWVSRARGPKKPGITETEYFFVQNGKSWKMKNWELHINSFLVLAFFSSRVIKDCMAMKRVGFVQNNCLTRSLHAEGVHIIKRYGKPMATECTTQAPVIKNDSMLPDVIMRAKRFDWHAS